MSGTPLWPDGMVSPTDQASAPPSGSAGGAAGELPGGEVSAGKGSESGVGRQPHEAAAAARSAAVRIWEFMVPED
jgi:hypothetical protein